MSTHDVVHLGERVVGRVDDEVGALVDDLQVVVGDERGDLDDQCACRVETGHLEIHPNQHVILPTVARPVADARPYLRPGTG